MRILHICQRDDPDEGGALRVGEAFVRGQRELGEDAWILFLYGDPGHLFEDLSPQAVCLGLNSSREALRGIPALKKEIARIAPDIIHSHDGILWPRLAYLNRKIPVVTHAHAPPGDMKKLKDKIGWPLTRMTTDGLIGISRHTIEAWRTSGFCSENVCLVPNGVDFNRFDPVDGPHKQNLRRDLELPEDRSILLWVGRLHNGTKGTDRLERIVKLMPSEMVMVVVGQGPEYDGICERCKPDIEKGRLLMAGSSPYPENYFKASDLFLFSSYQDAFGLVILEAVASELPVLSFPVTKGGGATELLFEFDAVELRDGMDAGELKMAIRKAEEQKSGSRILREKAQASYGWNALSRQVLNAYATTLQDWRNS